MKIAYIGNEDISKTFGVTKKIESKVKLWKNNFESYKI